MAGAMINEGSYKVCFIWVSKMFHEGFKDILRGIFEVVIKKFKEGFKYVSRFYQGDFNDVSRVFQEILKVFQGSVEKLARAFGVAVGHC